MEVVLHEPLALRGSAGLATVSSGAQSSTGQSLDDPLAADRQPSTGDSFTGGSSLDLSFELRFSF